MRDRDGNECTPNAAPDASDEFARGSDVWPDDPGGATRRSFLKRMAAALALAGVGGVGCSSRPEGETIVPYVDLPDGMVPGLPMTFASAMSFNGFARGVLVTTREGRPIKVDGNPDHPSSLGGSDAFVQASILDLYDPTRANAVTFAGQPVDWSQAFAAIDDRVALAATSGGVGLRVLTGATSSPTLIAQLESLLERMPHARWHRFEPLETGAAADGAMAAFGRPADVVYDFAHASVVVALDADFLVEGPGSLRYARDFATGRRVRDGRVTMNRLYVAEGSLTTTGARADHRLPCAPSAIADVAAALAWACGVEAASDRPTATSPDPDGRLARWASAVAVDLLAHRGTSIVLPGASQPPHVHTLAHQINAALGNVGTTVRYVEPIARSTVARGKGSLAGLVAAIDAGEVTTLLILADDPAHAAPADVDFADALAKLSKARRADGSLAHFTAHLSARPNATSYACQWHLPEAHYLEAWGDVPRSRRHGFDRAADDRAALQRQGRVRDRRPLARPSRSRRIRDRPRAVVASVRRRRLRGALARRAQARHRRRHGDPASVAAHLRFPRHVRGRVTRPPGCDKRRIHPDRPHRSLPHAPQSRRHRRRPHRPSLGHRLRARRILGEFVGPLRAPDAGGDDLHRRAAAGTAPGRPAPGRAAAVLARITPSSRCGNR